MQIELRKQNDIYPTLVLSVALVLLLALVFSKPLLMVPLLFVPPVLVFLKRPDWILYATIIIAFTRLDAWMSAGIGLPFGLLTAGTMLLALFLAVTFAESPLVAPNRPVLSLILFYGSAFLIGTLAGDTAHASEWSRDAAYALLTFGIVYTFTFDKGRLDVALKLVVICGLLLALVNVLEILFPASIHLSHSEGRAAGLLKNANASAFAITCSYIVLMLCARQPKSGIRLLFFLIIQAALFVGVLATFSREGLILISISFIAANVISIKSRKELATSFLSLSFNALIAFVLIQALCRSNDVAVFFSLEKVRAFLQGDLYDNYRMYLAKYYLSKAVSQPLTGFGFNATIAPSPANLDLLSYFGVKGPHNTFVTIFTEFGILPLILYGFIYASLLGKLKEIVATRERRLLSLLWLNLLFHNLFAHDVHFSRFIMVLIGLLAAYPALYVSTRNRQKPESSCAIVDS